jgi:DNA-binding transcriptional regulator LsrR (DeoR family)
MAIGPIERIIHKSAWLYYTHGMRQDDIAKQLNISRASVVMYLKKARDTGVVNISTSTQLFGDDVLARELEDALDLDTVWVVQEERSNGLAGEISTVAAAAFIEQIHKGDRVGVAWGRTIYQIADVMPYADLKGVTVLQLCGNLGTPYSYRPDQCTTEIARRLNAQGINLYAPLVLSSERLADELRAEPVIQEQLAMVLDCKLALYSVGTVTQDSQLVACGALTPREAIALGKAGAVGVVAGQLIDRQGDPLDCAFNRRCISADLSSIRGIPKRMMVVREKIKFDALVAAIRGHLVSHLVLSTSMARRLLDHAGIRSRE